MRARDKAAAERCENGPMLADWRCLPLRDAPPESDSVLALGLAIRVPLSLRNREARCLTNNVFKGPDRRTGPLWKSLGSPESAQSGPGHQAAR